MLPPNSVIFCAIAAFISGCSSLGGKEPFQIYAPRTDCVSCKKQEQWGFIEKLIYRNNKIAYFASFKPKTTSSSQLEQIGLCYGTAINTIKSGATHFRILDKKEWGDWHEVPTPATVSIDIFGTGKIYSGGMERKNLDQSYDMWWTNHYYEVGSPSCENAKDMCSEKHKFNLQDCPYEGDNLRKETEEKSGSLACVMKRNPRLLLHDVYFSKAQCGSSGSFAEFWMTVPDSTKKIIESRPDWKKFIESPNIDRDLDMGYWIPANDVIKKFEAIFNSDK